MDVQPLYLFFLKKGEVRRLIRLLLARRRKQLLPIKAPLLVRGAITRADEPTPYRDALMMMVVIHSRCWLEAVSVEAMEHPFFKFQIAIEFHILLRILQM